MNDLTFDIGGRTYGEPEAVHIRKSMLNLVGGFALRIPDFFEGSPGKLGIQMGQECVVKIDGVAMCTGYLDKMPIDYGVNDHSVELHGRDKACDLVDCSYYGDVSEWKNQTVISLIRTLASPFGITVKIEDGVEGVADQANTAIESFTPSEGAPIIELIERLCVQVGVTALSYGDGVLYITKGSSSKYMHDAIKLGSNAIAGYLDQDDTRRYSRYIVKGVGIGTDNKSLSSFIQPYSEARDTAMSRTRTLTMFADTVADNNLCGYKAAWEAQVRAGLSRAVEYEVVGWVQSNGKPWQINRRVSVKDSFLGMDDTMLIYALDHIADPDAGIITKIAVVPKETFSLNTKAIKGVWDQ
jgi:prophage tail gpP-like protein